MSESTREQFVRALGELGFSQYEARCYTGLVGIEPQTGYGLSKITGVPQPKVYETLRKLVARSAAYELAGEPAKFVAVPPTQLFSEIKSTFDDRLSEAELYSRNLTSAASIGVEVLEKLDSIELVTTAAIRTLETAKRRVYISAGGDETRLLHRHVVACADRGVDVVLLTFGTDEFVHDGIRTFRHASTDGALYRAHQARHVAVVADSRESLYGVAADGITWTGVRTTSVPIIAAVKGYIRHDIDMQQVYADFRTELVAAYGAGLQGLESYRQDRPVREDARDEEDSSARWVG